jgi:hypothetical protein
MAGLMVQAWLSVSSRVVWLVRDGAPQRGIVELMRGRRCCLRRWLRLGEREFLRVIGGLARLTERR